MDDDAIGGADEPFVLEAVPTKPLRRLRRLAVALVPLAALGAGVAVVARSDGPPDPALLLERAAEPLTDAENYHLELSTETHIATGDPGGVGAETTTRAVAVADLVGDDVYSRYEEAYPDGGGTSSFEFLDVDGRSFMKTDGSFDDSDTPPQWVEVPAPPETFEAGDGAEADWAEAELEWLEEMVESGDDGEVERTRLSLLMSGAPMDEDPAELSRLVVDAEDASYVESLPGGGDRITATLPPPEAFASLEPPLPAVAVTLDVDDAGRPVRATYRADEGSSWMAVEVAWSMWDAVEPLVAPTDDEIDHTPWIDEAALAALDPALLLAPTVAPDGLELSGANTYDAFEDECASFELSYDAPLPGTEDEEGGENIVSFDEWDYLYVSTASASCLADGGFDQDFDETFAGFPAVVDDGYVEVLMDEIVVTLDTSMDAAALEPVITSLAPITVDALVAALPADGGGSFGYARGPGSRVRVTGGFEIISEPEG